MCGIWCSQCRLLCWKNYKLKTRSCGTTCLELALPSFAFIILLIMRSAVPIDTIDSALLTENVMSVSENTPYALVPFFCGGVFGTEFSTAPVTRYPRERLVIAPLNKDDPNVPHSALVALAAHIRSALAVAVTSYPGDPAGYVNVAHTFVQTACPELPDTATRLAYVTTDGPSGLVQIRDSSQAIDDYIDTDGYGIDPSIEVYNVAIIVNSISTTGWDYSLRGNSTTMAFGDSVDNFRVLFNQNAFQTYMLNGMLPLKMLIDQYIINQVVPGGGGPNFPTVPTDNVFLPFPLAKHQHDSFADSLSQVFGLFLVLSFVWPFSRLVRHMVEEKEVRLKEGMKIMGLKNSVFWASWGFTYLVMFFLVTLLAIVLASLAIFRHTNGGIIFSYFMTFSLSLISLGFMVSALFTQAKTAGTLSPFVMLVAFLPFFFVSPDSRSFATKSLASLLSPVAFGLGGVKILQYEAAFIGSQWDNVNEMTGNYSLGTALGYMFLDFFLYGFIAWYLDTVMPTEYGTNEAPWFLCTTRFWETCCCSEDTKSSISDAMSDQNSYAALGSATPGVTRVPLLPTGESKSGITGRAGGILPPTDETGESMDRDPDAIPDEPVNEQLAASVGVRIRQLRKTFGSDENKFVAVNSLDLDLYTGQIFVLLGHNGAGKSTTINMLTGMFPPTSGNAYINGHDIVNHMPYVCSVSLPCHPRVRRLIVLVACSEVRRELGICPQHDVLFPTLTVEEHLMFFGALKHLEGQELAAAVQTAIDEVQLSHATHQPAGSLSGGQKRRLSLAIALIGGSKIVFLDEPTSGVDPSSRRAIWELLTKKKAGRIIVLTTHFMDEADQLGDRIAIMHHGKKKVCGSSLYLKRKFGVGYTFTLSKVNKDAKSSDITALISSHVPDSEKLSDVGTEISFRLPLAASSKFPAMLKQLDVSKDVLGVQNYGLSVTTLEEVFIKVATSKDEKENEKVIQKLSSRRSLASTRALNEPADQKKDVRAPSIVDGPSSEDAENSGEYLSASADNQHFSRHFNALFMKRFHIAKRDQRGLFCTLVLPIVIVLLGLSFGMIPASLFTKPVSLTTDQFNQNPLPTPVNRYVNELYTDQTTHQPLLKFQPYMMAGNITTYDQMAQAILDVRATKEQSAFGAFFQTDNSDVSKYKPTIFANMTGSEGLPTFQHVAHNALLRNLSGNPDAYIHADMIPFRFTRAQVAELNRFNGLTTAIVVAIGFCFVPSAIAVFVVKEREVKSKHIQIISGVSIEAYWLSSYAWDFLVCLIPSVLGAFIVLGFGNANFTGDNFGSVFLTMIFYALSVVPFTYVMSFLFVSHSTAQNVMIMIYLVSGLLMSIVSFVLFVIPSTRDANTTYIRPLFRLFPSFCLGDALIALSFRELLEKGPWDRTITGDGIIFMAWESVVYFALTIFIERAANIPAIVKMFKIDPVVQDRPTVLDSDVAAEKQRVQSGGAAGDLIRIEGLRKTFAPAKAAAKDVWYGVPSGECFGFLGVNGAGKTTTLSMLTGEITPSSGAAYLGGHNVATDPVEVQKLMGYCPQFDALHDLLTSKETLEFYARIRGVPENRIDGMVDFLITRLSLTEYKNKPSGTYSGGNKRKLSVAIALIGNPKVVFLDEPSTGMDPVSRRFMWTFISETMAKRAVILTTHSMEECEALCHRIGIFAAGQLQCIGSSQHLKNKFGRGFQLDISTGGRAVDSARRWVAATFPGCTELECYASFMKFRIPPQPNLSLADIFERVESNKIAVDIAEYSIGQTTLEQIFLHFANEQLALDAGAVSSLSGGVPVAQALMDAPVAGPRGYVRPSQVAVNINASGGGYQPPQLIPESVERSDGKTNH